MAITLDQARIDRLTRLVAEKRTAAAAFVSTLEHAETRQLFDIWLRQLDDVTALWLEAAVNADDQRGHEAFLNAADSQFHVTARALDELKERIAAHGPSARLIG